MLNCKMRKYFVLFILFMGMTSVLTAATKDEKYARAITTKLNTVQKQIEENYKIETIQESFAKATTFFERLSDEYKSQGGEVVERYNMLSSQINTLASGGSIVSNSPAKVSSSDSKNARVLATKMKTFKYDVDHGKNLLTMQTSQGRALDYINQLSDDYKSSEAGAEVITQYNELSLVVTKAEEVYNAKSATNDKYNAQAREFSPDKLKPYIDIYWSIIAPGRDGKIPKLDMDDFEKLDNYLAQFKSFEKEFRSKFSLLIDGGKKHETGYPYFASIPQFIDAFEHADEYFTKAIDIYTADYANEIFETLNGGLAQTEDGYIPYTMLTNIYPKDLSDYPTFMELKRIYSKMGKSIPDEYMNEINSITNKMYENLINTSKNNKWKKSEYSYTTNEMKKLFNDEYNGKLINIGAPKDNEWTIIRNSLGIILRKSAEGMVVYRDKTFPFDIGVKLYFTKQYDGKSYGDVSSIDLDFYCFPYKQ